MKDHGHIRQFRSMPNKRAWHTDSLTKTGKTVLAPKSKFAGTVLEQGKSHHVGITDMSKQTKIETNIIDAEVSRTPTSSVAPKNALRALQDPARVGSPLFWSPRLTEDQMERVFVSREVKAVLPRPLPSLPPVEHLTPAQSLHVPTTMSRSSIEPASSPCTPDLNSSKVVLKSVPMPSTGASNPTHVRAVSGPPVSLYPKHARSLNADESQLPAPSPRAQETRDTVRQNTDGSSLSGAVNIEYTRSEGHEVHANSRRVGVSHGFAGVDWFQYRNVVEQKDGGAYSKAQRPGSRAKKTKASKGSRARKLRLPK